MLKYQFMSDKELLKIVIRERGNVVDELFNEFNTLSEALIHSDQIELLNIKGIGEKTAMQIKAIFELTRRLYKESIKDITSITSPTDVSDLLMEEMRYLKQEELRVLLLNTKNNVLRIEKVSRGSISSSIAHPSDIFRQAIKIGAASIILVHQHPSGDPTPSKEDVDITKRIVECGKLLGIGMLDHIIIGSGRYVSLKEKGLM